LVRQKRKTPFTTEQDYNNAMIAACLSNGVEAIAITDHFRVKTAKALADLAASSGIKVFPGFEAVSKDGIHLLCLFDPETTEEVLERAIGGLGVSDGKVVSPLSTQDCESIVRLCAERWNGITIAAHVANPGGLLETLRGQPTVVPWTSRDLLACSVSSLTKDLPEPIRDVIANRNVEYRRDRPIAILNALDVFDPTDLANPLATCLIKMSNVSVEGLRQAFLDPASRIRLNSDPVPGEHAEFVAIAWEGGFLDGTGIHFNENLNVLIGGRGVGKSTVIESLRHVLGLEATTDEAKKAAQGIVKSVLQPGTKISLLVHSPRPKSSDYVIERTIPNLPVVRSLDGSALELRPMDILRGVEVYGQHEISELTRSRERLTQLLARFTEEDKDLPRKLALAQEALEGSRIEMLSLGKERQTVETRLGQLPSIEATLKRYQDAGLEEKLKDQSALVVEEQLIKRAVGTTAPFRAAVKTIKSLLPIDSTMVAQERIGHLPGAGLISNSVPVLEQLTRVVSPFTPVNGSHSVPFHHWCPSSVRCVGSHPPLLHHHFPSGEKVTSEMTAREVGESSSVSLAVSRTSETLSAPFASAGRGGASERSPAKGIQRVPSYIVPPSSETAAFHLAPSQYHW
jgi:hypothetical protein